MPHTDSIAIAALTEKYGTRLERLTLNQKFHLLSILATGLQHVEMTGREFQIVHFPPINDEALMLLNGEPRKVILDLMQAILAQVSAADSSDEVQPESSWSLISSFS